MLDLKLIRERADFVRDRLARRGRPEYVAAVDDVLSLDEERRKAIATVDEMRARRNEVTPKVGRLKKEGRDAEAEPLIREMRELGGRMSALEARRSELEGAVRDLLLDIPNIPEDAVPAGGEENNVVLRTWGSQCAFPFEPRPHWEIAERLRMLDLPRGSKVAGSGFPLYTDWGARLERALIALMLDMHIHEHGYTEISPPFLINTDAALGTGHLPKFGDDMYHVEADGLYLVPTAEVPVTNLYAGELLDPDVLPRRFVAYTPCFRREAGSHGKDTRGLLRLHQFDKVELVRFERRESGNQALEELTSHAEAVLRRLGLHYRVVLLAGGDLGFASAQTYDLEVWSPGVSRWLEVSSCSVYHDFQSRRADVRYRPAAGEKPEFVTTLNGSGVALARTFAAIVETYQEADGSLGIPPALADYLGTDRITV